MSAEYIVRVVKQSPPAQTIFFQRFKNHEHVIKAFALQYHTIRRVARLPDDAIDSEQWRQLGVVIEHGGAMTVELPDANLIVEKLV